jgi:outer membrane lipase/esterase
LPFFFGDTMRFFSKQGPRRAVGRQSALQRGVLAGVVAGLFAAMLVACGGGTTQQEPYVPNRVLVIGDEYSVLTAEGRKFAVNGVKADGSGLDCAAEPLWVQSVAGYYGYTFSECNSTSATTFKAVNRARAKATVADLEKQVDEHLAQGGIQERDLVLALGGANDVMALFARYPAETKESLLGQARASGERMAGVVNRLVALKARVIVSTIPDLGLSPFALVQDLFTPGSAAFLAELSKAFNERLGVKVLLDGRFVGLMQTDLRTQQVSRLPQAYLGMTNASVGVCTVALPNCTTATLLPDTTPAAYFWADGTWFSTGGQAQLATLALERAQRNPF